MRLFIYVIIMTISLLSCKNEPSSNFEEYVLLKQIVLDENEYREIDKVFNKEEVIKISSVLIYYGVNLKVVNDSIFISRKNHSDLNYLYNIQNKSKDSLWYYNHIFDTDSTYLQSMLKSK